MKIAFIGMGTMGAPMALNLLKAGYTVTVHNRTRDREAPLATAGAQRAASPQAAAADADVVITCVSDTPDVEAILLGKQGVIHSARPGTTVVDMSTISPQATQTMAAVLGAKAIAMVDAPVSGGSEGAKHGTLSIMVGGAVETVEQVRPVLTAMGSTITHIGPIGSGQLTKAINQIIVAGTYWSVAEGLALGLKAGLDMDQVVQAVGGGAAGSWGLTHRSGNMIANDYPLGFRVRLHQKDLNIALGAARDLGVPLPMAAYVEQIETGLISRGYGDEDISAIARTVREQAGLDER
ncbi:MAG: NAD(P)-dependent oxidoreductase [Cyanobacteria bacterium]|nr:NAD(P)-dependent oxidoreductase [Cyanobacteriota bacterium]MDA0864839.1 NAD(P)-dependent oxidoreductase [Cyanobacteriota bacterium]